MFKLDTSGNETVLYSFTGGFDGNLPHAGLITDSVGNLYGTTYYSGASTFIAEVNDLANSGVLSPSRAAALIRAAESVIARLS